MFPLPSPSGSLATFEPSPTTKGILLVSTPVERLRSARLLKNTLRHEAIMFSLKRCPVCSVGTSFCICSSQQTITLPFALTILSNPDEFRKPTNTARLVANSDSSVDILEWKRTEPPRNLLKQIEDDDGRTFGSRTATPSITFSPYW